MGKISTEEGERALALAKAIRLDLSNHDLEFDNATTEQIEESRDRVTWLVASDHNAILAKQSEPPRSQEAYDKLFPIGITLESRHIPAPDPAVPDGIKADWRFLELAKTGDFEKFAWYRKS